MKATARRFQGRPSSKAERAPRAIAFGHSRREISFWRRLAAQAIQQVPTPFYLFSADPLLGAIEEMDAALCTSPVPVRHWLSCKTQPLAPLLQWWQPQGRPIEVVSEYEFRAAIRTGFKPPEILVNGPAKHRWLPNLADQTMIGLSVNFDSLSELKALLPCAKQLHWRVGIRLQTAQEFDPEHPGQPTQFGFTAAEAQPALRALQRAGIHPEIVHFHLRTNVASPQIYERAIQEVAGICQAAKFSPHYLDCGGGWPPRHTCSHDGTFYAAEFDAPRLKCARELFPDLREIWLENGRFVSARCGVLVISVLDVKDRPGMRQLICNGGRTMNALVSSWEQHELLCLPERRGRQVFTTVYGPTCMVFDQLARRPLPKTIRAGDHLIWLEAGAYHLPWETRFSHGLAAVVWHEAGSLQITRPPESFDQWWGRAGASCA